MATTSTRTRARGGRRNAFHFLLDSLDERQRVAGGALAQVDEEVGVMGRDLQIADAKSLEARLFDQSSREVALRFDEDGPTGRNLGRLVRLS